MSSDDPQRDPRDEPGQDDRSDPSEGWEALTEEPDGGALSPSDELEAALREASDALEAKGEGHAHPRTARGSSSSDKTLMEALSKELQSLKTEYEARVAELEALKDRHLRLQAEFENFRRRGLKEREEAHHYGHQNLVKDLLATVDNLERAVDHAEQSGGGDLQALLQGVELVRRELLAALGKHGVRVIEPGENEAFDPAVHEAMAQMPDGSVPPNTVVEVLQKGYQLRDRMLRPARVLVSRTPAPGETTDEKGRG